MARPFRLFGGGPVGTGRQFHPWIHWRDWVGIVTWALAAGTVAGPVNLSAPTPVRNSDFGSAIAAVLKRPSWLPVPAAAVRAALGEMGQALLLTSTRMVPARALSVGYRFQFTDVGEALRDLLA
jgi:NAD dependent epimerase/dehydratase family enzyme